MPEAPPCSPLAAPPPRRQTTLSTLIPIMLAFRNTGNSQRTRGFPNGSANAAQCGPPYGTDP